MTIRKVTQEMLDRVTGELAAAEGTLVAAVEAHDLACSMVAADIEVGEISVGDAAARTQATAEQLERATTLVDRLSRALPELVARLATQADADAEKAAAKHAAEVTKLSEVANAVSLKLAGALGAAEELAGVLLLARAAVDGLADTAGAGRGGTADPPLSGARPLAAHARGTGHKVPQTGFLDEPEWGSTVALQEVLASGPRRLYADLLAVEKERLESVAQQHLDILDWASKMAYTRVPLLLIRDDLPEETKATARRILADAVAAREARENPVNEVPAPEPEPAVEVAA